MAFKTRLLPTAIAAAIGATALPAAAAAYSEHSVGTPEQIAWVKRAATNFVNDELAGNGAGTCGILNSPMRAYVHHRSCEQRWDSRLAAMLRNHADRAQLHAERRAIAAARVVVHGNVASIELPAPLDKSAGNHFLWTENCWMLEG